MIRTLITILCPLPQEHEQDIGLGPFETGSTEQAGGVCGGKGEHGQAEGLEPCAGSAMDEAVELGMPGDKMRKEETQCSSTRLRIRTVSAVGSRGGLFAGSWGVFATTDLCWQQSPFPVHTQG